RGGDGGRQAQRASARGRSCAQAHLAHGPAWRGSRAGRLRPDGRARGTTERDGWPERFGGTWTSRGDAEVHEQPVREAVAEVDPVTCPSGSVAAVPAPWRSHCPVPVMDLVAIDGPKVSAYDYRSLRRVGA